MELPEDEIWLHVENSFFVFLITVNQLQMSEEVHRILGTPTSIELVNFLTKHRQAMFPVRGINLL